LGSTIFKKRTCKELGSTGTENSIEMGGRARKKKEKKKKEKKKKKLLPQAFLTRVEMRVMLAVKENSCPPGKRLRIQLKQLLVASYFTFPC
jgi:hypothetical protein